MLATHPVPSVSLNQCRHCGAAAATRVVDAQRFCCQGCARVYAILKDQNLLDYYDFSDNRLASLKERPAADFTYCDTVWFRQTFAQAAGEGRYRIRLKLPAIHCAACVWLLEKLPTMLPEVRAARINYLRKYIDIVALGTLPLSRLITFVADLGYTPDFSAERKSTKKLSEHDRRLVRKLAVAAFGFGNAMLFSLPEYFSPRVETSFAQTFVILNALLATVVLVYSAGDFFLNAWRALKQKKIILDFPIALGIAAMFARSAVDILTGASPGYFDTFMGLVFFLLIGRYVQSRSYAWLNFERDNLLFLPLAVRVKTATGERVTPVQEIKVGDHLRLLGGEITPVRAKVLSDNATVDYAFITGESEPVVIPQGAILELGGKIIGQSVAVEVLEAIDSAKLNRIWEDAGSGDAMAGAALATSNFAEKVLPYFTGIVLVVAMAALVYWLPKDGAQAWNAFSAVLVITCPCALAMAKPFSFFTTQSVLARAGLFLKSTAIVEKFFRLRTIVFDKTGTLTSTSNYDVRYIAQGAEISSSELSLFSVVANESTHPLAHAVALKGRASENFVLSDFVERAGRGLSARCNGRRVLLGSPSWLAENGVAVTPTTTLTTSAVFAAIDGKYCGYFAIENTLRGDLRATVAALQENYDVALLSGDGERERTRFASIFEFAPATRAGIAKKDSLYFNATPTKKAQIVGDLKVRGPVMMIGDGLNDAAAIAAADLGVAITENHSNFSPASDAILSANAFVKLPRLIAMAKQAQSVAIFAYLLSFAYNIFGVSVAVSGSLTPLFCAILMPLSSLSVIGLSFASARIGGLVRGLR